MAKKSIDKAYEIVRNYEGENNKIRYMHKLYVGGQLGVLSDFDVEYVNNNHDYKPTYPNSIVHITRELGEKLYDKNNLAFIPEKIKITKIIGEMGGSLHCYMKYRQSEPEKLVWVSQRGILNPINKIDWKNYDVDFTPFDAVRPLKEHQKDGVKFLLANKKCILADSMGLGKEQPNDTIIPTPYGYKLFGDLKIGDLVFGRDGNEHKILGVYPQGLKNTYDVNFKNGISTVCGLEHLWIVQEFHNGKKCHKEEVLSLKQIITRLKEYEKYKRECKKKGEEPYSYEIGVPITCPVKYFTKELDTDPYTFGLSIGEKCKDKYFSKENLFIPCSYLTADVKQRKALLCGLLESNGVVRKGKSYISFKTNFKTLVPNIVELVESLGGYIKLTDKESFSIIRIYLEFNPFKSKKMKSKFSFMKSDKPFYHMIKNIKFHDLEECRCIKVDSYDESYLTNDYIVTHNTTTSIVASIAGNFKKILIICPASLKSNWKREIGYYADENDVDIIKGSNWKSPKKFTIINYDIIDNFYEVPLEPEYEMKEITNDKGKVVETLKVPKYVKNKYTGEFEIKMKKSNRKDLIKESLKNSPLFLSNYDCVIIDEAQKLSNKGSIRYTTISDFLKRGKPEAVFLLTGTPLTNNPMNLYNILSLIDANVTKDYTYYVKKFCGAREMKLKDGRIITKMGKPQNLDELREKIKPIYLRRLASETGDMVGKEVIRKYYDLNEKQTIEYNRLWDEYQKAQEEQGNDDSEAYRQLVEGTLVRQYLSKEMVKHTIDMVDDLIDNGEKVVIMTCFKEEMDMFVKHYGKKCVYYRGGMTTKQKDKAEDKFMHDDKIMIFVGQIIAAGTGLSLPAAKYCIFNSYSWSYSDNVQAEDRIYRLTQTRDVECIYQLFTDSISQDMFDKVIYKKLLQDALIKSEINK